MNGKIDAISRRVGSGGGSGRGVSDGEIISFHDFFCVTLFVWHYYHSRPPSTPLFAFTTRLKNINLQLVLIIFGKLICAKKLLVNCWWKFMLLQCTPLIWITLVQEKNDTLIIKLTEIFSVLFWNTLGPEM